MLSLFSIPGRLKELARLERVDVHNAQPGFEKQLSQSSEGTAFVRQRGTLALCG